MTPAEHYRRADELLELAGAHLRTVLDSIRDGTLFGEDALVELAASRASTAIAQAHATLATVTE